MKKVKQLLAVLLSVMMLIGNMPVNVFAEEPVSETVELTEGAELVEEIIKANNEGESPAWSISETTVNLSVNSGESVTLKIPFDEGSSTDGLMYYWNSINNPTYIETTESEFWVDNINESTTYYCDVEDGNGNYSTVTFVITVSEPAFDFDEYESPITKFINAGDTVTLQIPFTVDSDISDFSFEWFKNEEETPFTVTDNSDITLESVTEETDIFCNIYKHDIFVKAIDYKVCINPSFSVTSGSVMHKVDFYGNVEDMSQLLPLSDNYYLEKVYSWEKYNAEIDGYEFVCNGSFSLNCVTKSEKYRCKVTDVYGTCTDTIEINIVAEEVPYLRGEEESYYFSMNGGNNKWFIFPVTESACYRITLGLESDYYENAGISVYDTDFNPVSECNGCLNTVYLSAENNYYIKISDRYSDNSDMNGNINIHKIPTYHYSSGDNQPLQYPEEGVYKIYTDSWNYFVISDSNGEIILEAETDIDKVRYVMLKSNETYTLSCGADINLLMEYVAPVYIPFEINRDELVTEYLVDPNNSFSLSVPIIQNESTDLHYVWCWDSLEKEYEPELIFNIIDRNYTIECTITDSYGVSETITFNVKGKKVWTLTTDSVEYDIDLGTTAELCVPGDYSTTTVTLYYDWYKDSTDDENHIDEDKIVHITEPLTEDTYYYCIVNDNFGNTETVNFLVKINEHTEHFFILESSTTATCIENGYETYKCDGCDEVKTETIPATGHTEVTDEAIEPTCVDIGLTEGSHCSVCGEVLTAQEEIPAIGHSFTNYVSNNDATYISDGTTTAICNNGCGEKSKVIDIDSKLPKTALTKEMISLSYTSKAYTGSALKPTVTVKVGSSTLSSDVYSVSYSNNIGLGTATVKVTAKDGDYPISGSASKTFTISKANPTVTAPVAKKLTYTGSAQALVTAGTTTGGTLKYCLTSGGTYSTTIPKKTNVGIYKVYYKVVSSTNYSGTTAKSVTVNILPKKATVSSYKNTNTGIKLTWGKVTGATGYYVYRGTTKIKTVTSGSTVTCTDTAVKDKPNATKYTYYVQAYYKNSAGTVIKGAKSTGKATYRMKAPASLTLTAGTKYITVTVPKVSGVGYEIWRATSSTGTYTKVIATTSNTYKNTGLTSGKTYYYKVRTYKTIDGVKVYSDYCPVKYAKAK